MSYPEPPSIINKKGKLVASEHSINATKPFPESKSIIKPSNFKVSDKEDFESSTQIALFSINHPLLGREKILSTTKNYYSFINKNNKTYNFDLVKTLLYDDRKRYLLTDSEYKDIIASGAILSKDNELVAIKTDSFARDIGLAQQLLKAIYNDFGELKVSEPVSKVGAKAIYKFYENLRQKAYKLIIPDFIPLKEKTEIAFFGSVLEKTISEIHDIDLIITAPKKVYKELKDISKKYNKPLDIFIPPLSDRTGKIIIYPNGKTKKSDSYTPDGFFDDAKDIKEIM